MKKRVLSIVCLAVGAGFFLAFTRRPSPPAVGAKSVAETGQCSVLDPLDAAIQDRFIFGELEFGFERVGPLRVHLPRFAARTDAERAAVAELESNHWQAAFYLAGRTMLAEKGVQGSETNSDFSQGQGFHGPVLMTPRTFQSEPMKNLPLSRTEARKALDHLMKNNQYETSLGTWELLARPLRMRAECLKCHLSMDRPNLREMGPSMVNSESGSTSKESKPKSSLKTGDLLGAAIYLYRRTRT